MPSASNLFGALLFGIIGLAAFRYGKKAVLWKPMGIGVALMAYPYFVEQTWLLYAIGALLCGAFFVFKE
jgi:hypothetical protein